MGYFGSGVRPVDVRAGALHAAARCAGSTCAPPARSASSRAIADEPAPAFLARILERPPRPPRWGCGRRRPARVPARLPLERPVSPRCIGGPELADGSTCYALFREQAGATILRVFADRAADAPRPYALGLPGAFLASNESRRRRAPCSN